MNTRIKYQAYFDQFVTNGFYPKIVQPCRFTKKTGSVIDHTFCKLSENTSKSYSGILISNMSDHLPHFTCLDILSNQQKPPKYIIKGKHDEASLLSFYNEIESSLRNTHFPNELTTDPNVTYSVSPIYRGRVYRGIGYIAVACWTPFFCPPISQILQTWRPRARYFSRNRGNSLHSIRGRQFFAKSAHRDSLCSCSLETIFREINSSLPVNGGLEHMLCDGQPR